MTGTIGADTTLLIDFFSGEDSAVDFMKKNFKLLRVSELVVYEFLCGNLTKKEKDIFLSGIQSYPSIGLNREAVFIASNLFREAKRTGKTIGHQDSLIAGSYLAAGIRSIATRNPKHFMKIKDVVTIDYS